MPREIEFEPDEIYARIDEHWRGRVKHQHLKGEELLTKQAEFFTGAMAALSAVGLCDAESMPPQWVIPVMSGQPISSTPSTPSKEQS